MSIYINKDTRVITQGITGKTGQFHTRMCRDYANGKEAFVAGVNPKKAGEDFEGIPIFANVTEAAKATGATVSVIYVPPAGAAAAIELGDVHRRHGQAGAVDQAADVAVERDVVEIELRGLDFIRVLLVEVTHRDDIGMAEQRVVVEIHFRIKRNHVAGVGEYQRIDLGERRVGLVECFI